jgi:hypothetical protein
MGSLHFVEISRGRVDLSVETEFEFWCITYYVSVGMGVRATSLT